MISYGIELSEESLSLLPTALILKGSLLGSPFLFLHLLSHLHDIRVELSSIVLEN